MKLNSNIFIISKIYGYVKYFYPSSKVQDVCWHKILIYALDKYSEVNDTDALIKSILEFFSPVAPLMLIKKNEHLSKYSNTKKINSLTPIYWQHKGVQSCIRKELYRSLLIENLNPNDFSLNLSYPFRNIEKAKRIKISLKIMNIDIQEGMLNVNCYIYQGINKKELHKKNIVLNKENSQTLTNIESKIYLKEYYPHLFFEISIRGAVSIVIENINLYYLQDKSNVWEEVTRVSTDFKEMESGNSPAVWLLSGDYNSYTYGFRTTPKDSNVFLIEFNNYLQLFENTLISNRHFTSKLTDELAITFPLLVENNELENEIEFKKFKTKIDRVEISKTIENEINQIASIIILWNILQHFFPYREVMNKWNKHLKKYINILLGKKYNSDEFYFLLRSFIGVLEDGHSYVVYPNKPKIGKKLPIQVGKIEEDVIVLASKDNSPFKKGDKILKMEEEDINIYVENNYRNYTFGRKERRINEFLKYNFSMGEKDSLVKVLIERENRQINITTYRSMSVMEGVHLTEWNYDSIALLENNIYYVNLTKVYMEDITKKIDDLVNARGVVFDLRGYPKDNFSKLLRHLLHKKDTVDWMHIPCISNPNFQNVQFEKSGWKLLPCAPTFKNKIVFLSNSRAISAAESVLGIVKHYKLGTIIGTNTAGTNGNVNCIDLINSIQVYFTGMKVTDLEGDSYYRIGIQPDLYIERSIEGVLRGEDEYLMAAIEFISV
ncbi:MAG: S41 family peptidase [Chitinophagales bacterium]